MKLYNGDCVEVMKKLSNDSIDMSITSPPYDNLRNYKGNTSFDISSITKELFRITKEGGVVVWVVADATINKSETGSSFNQAINFMSVGFKLHDTMIFAKNNPIPQIYRKRYNNEFEYMFVFSKEYVKTHNAIKVPTIHGGLKLKNTTYKNYSKNEQSREKKAKPVKNEKIKGNIWYYTVGVNKVDKQSKFHPAPFPYKLAEDHIISWTNEGDTVLDPMMGSGSVGLACKKNNRKFIGIEIEKEYFDLAKERIETR